jgi:hypothetical protein
MQLVVEVVAPLRVQTEAAHLARPEQARIVQIVLGDEDQLAPQLRLTTQRLGAVPPISPPGRWAMGVDTRRRRRRASAIDDRRLASQSTKASLRAS